MELPSNVVRISDRRCVDCDGEVVLFGVPDKVWSGLGLKPEDWICLDCLAKRLNPDSPATSINEIAQQIIWKRHRFGLKKENVYGGWLAKEDQVLFPLDFSLVLMTSDNSEFDYLTGAEAGERSSVRNYYARLADEKAGQPRGPRP